MATSTLTFLLIEEGSMSAWIFFAALAEGIQAAGDAVVEARAQVQHDVAAMHDQVGLVGAVHPSMPRNCLSLDGKAPRPISVLVQGMPVSRTNSPRQARRLGAGVDDAATGVDHRPLERLSMRTASRIGPASGSRRGR
jgi:hypothetical protein